MSDSSVPLTPVVDTPEMKQALELGWQLRAFHGKVRRARRAKGLTQREVAKVVGIPINTLGDIELLKHRPEPDVRDNLADFLGLTPQEVWPDWLEPLSGSLTAVTYAEYSPVQFSALTNQQRRETLLLEDRSDDPAESLANHELLATNLEAALAQLPSRERRVIEMRFGLNGALPLTLKECGERLGVCGQRVRDIEQRALRRLRDRPGTKEKIEAAALACSIYVCSCGKDYRVARFCEKCKRQGCGRCMCRRNQQGRYVYLCRACDKKTPWSAED